MGQQAIGKQQVYFMPRLYDETMHLLVQAKNYFSIYSSEDQQQLASVERLLYSAVMSRITLRLSSSMGWILARRAFHAGQLTQEEVENYYRLQFPHECLLDSKELESILPSFVRKLCNESLALYSRIHALDNIPHAHSA